MHRNLEILGRKHPEIVAIYLFGSKAAGKAGPLSDVDIAVLLDSTKVPPRRYFQIKLRLITEAMEAIHRSDVDLVLLNEAPPSLAYEVIRSGQLVYERSHDQRVLFEARTMRTCLDMEPLYRIHRAYLKRHLLDSKRG